MSDTRDQGAASAVTTSPIVVGAAWLAVGTPLAYGLWQTILRASKLFAG